MGQKMTHMGRKGSLGRRVLRGVDDDGCDGRLTAEQPMSQVSTVLRLSSIPRITRGLFLAKIRLLKSQTRG